ncbi:thymidylate kinase (plasmid) [Streptomyces alboflavus]|uniref:Thymidylate kinase n=1 Tax=Streptomyces alboflavus TaxID=67267 RepID=A0A291W4Y8_9ACTN|nr:thymidylate kinase [Streptomyces alboflavus]ATM24612.1 thymidylate kinase [Streptomyces alboflavus]
MSAAAVPAPRREAAGARPLWVSVEGINGVGKTTAARDVAAALGTGCLLLDELTDQARDTLPGRVIAALSAKDDVCLRTGHPVAETLALLALKVREAERLAALPDQPKLVLEDRGIDSVAVCQAAILCAQLPQADPVDVARHVLASMARWYRLPDATVLLTGDLTVCAGRFAARINRTLAPRDLRVIEQTELLYTVLAAAEPDRFTVIDTRGQPPEAVAEALGAVVRSLVEKREAGHAA